MKASGAGTPPSSLKTQDNYKASNAEVKACAKGRWIEILKAHGIPEHYLSGKPSPCPKCSGKDRFRFDDKNGDGTFICNQCGAGDGFNLIKIVLHLRNEEAFKLVAKYLGLSRQSASKKDNQECFTNPIEQPNNQRDTKLEQEQNLLAKKKDASFHAEKLLSQCVERSHQYLQNKGINQTVLVNTKNYKITEKETVYVDAMVIPIYNIHNNQQLIGVQYINANCKKPYPYITGTPIKEGIHVLKGDSNLPYVGVVEGYATGLSVFLATGATVVVAFDANGIEGKAERLKTSFPGKQLVFFSDNDTNNIGQKKAHSAATKTNGVVITPPETGQDWNDYHQTHGLDATKTEITKQLSEAKTPKEPKMSVIENNVVKLAAKSKLNYDLIPLECFPFVRDKGKIVNTIENIECLLNYYNIKTRFNLVNKRIEISIPEKEHSQTNEDEVKLSHIAALCVKNRVPKTDLQSWILSIADDNRYSPAIEWIDSKPWDKTSRLDDFINTITADNPKLAKILICRWMLGAVAAAFSKKGVSLPGVLVLQGNQGIGKTAWFKSLVPTNHHNLIAEGQTLDPRNKDSVIGCTNRWLVELGELDGTFNRSDMAALKAFLTKDTDYYRVPYAKTESKASRNTAFFGSVNNSQYLTDETGNRRWWTISAKEINYNHDIDMQQVWAQFKYLLDAGESYYLTKDEANLLNSENELFESVDPIEEMILNKFKWNEKGYYNKQLTACEVLHIIGYDLTNYNAKAMGKKCGNILAKLTGQKAKRSNGKSYYYLPRQSANQEEHL